MSCTTQHLLLRSARRLSRDSRRASVVRPGGRIGNLASKGRWSPRCAVPSAAASTSSADAPWLFVGLGNPGTPPSLTLRQSASLLYVHAGLHSIWLDAHAACEVTDLLPGLKL